MFVNGRVAVTAQGIIDEKDITPATDVIFIRTKMDYGTRQRVIGAAAKLEQRKANAKTKRGKKGEADVQFDVGAYQVALLAHNVLGWQGPSFAGVACVASNIERLDMDEPLVQKVLDEVTSRNVTTQPDEDADDEDADDEGNAPALPVTAIS